MEINIQQPDEYEAMPLARRRELINELRGCAERAQGGDREALIRVREIFKETPRLAKTYINLASMAERSLLKTVAGDNPLIQEALPPQLRTMRKELAGPDASPLERLLAERIVACWLQLHCAETIYVQNLNDMSMPQNEYYQRRLDRLHRRYLSSIKALAQIRKLGPVVQVNIAEQQINKAG